MITMVSPQIDIMKEGGKEMKLILEVGIPGAGIMEADTETVAIFDIENEVLGKLETAPHICLKVVDDGDELLWQCYELTKEM